MKRRGLILSSLMRFKQICNHPIQSPGDGDYAEERSGKFMRLLELAEEIASRQVKVVILPSFIDLVKALCGHDFSSDRQRNRQSYRRVKEDSGNEDRGQ